MDLHEEMEYGIPILLHAALARLIAVSDALKWKASFLKSVDWQFVIPAYCLLSLKNLCSASHKFFKGLKSSGFNIEDSHVRIQERMANLFAIVMLAYVWCYLVGIYIHENIKKIKVLHHGRRAKSLFKYGLEYISQCLLNHTNCYRIDIFKFLSYT